ncbi:methyltransferase domain-containing protein [Gammaproteobacteria bacterium]|nr:methyltransferase domain-containing protein [Gammaproteobacteria bacterium]
MAIDTKKVMDFWSSRVEKMGTIPVEALTNLEENKSLMDEKVSLEQNKVFQWINPTDETTILDLGAGIGNWSLPLAKKSKKVLAVEYIDNLVEIGRKLAADAGIKNIEFICAPAQDYVCNTKVDLVFISGLFVYLNDDDCERLIGNLGSCCHESTQIFVRDGTGIGERREINNKDSELLNAKYSAIYRTKDEYIKLFKGLGYELKKDDDMFPEGHQLNKYPETRLRIYMFEKIQ